MTIDDVLADGAPAVMAILRGLRPDEALAIGDALVGAGIRLIEVPFNSPEPELSIATLAKTFGDRAAIGGGTVLSAEMVDRLAGAGGRFMVSPNTDPAVIRHAIAAGLDVLPGFATPTEAFVAIGAGARRLKLFPGTAFGPAYLGALKDVLPREVSLWAVGGAGADTAEAWRKAGAFGIGVGGSLYRPGRTAAEVGERARALVQAWSAAG